MNTRKKLVISYVLAVFLPVLLVGVLLTGNMKEIALENAIDEAKNNVERVVKRFQDILNISITISLKLQGSAELENIIYDEYESDWDVLNTYFNYKEFDELKTLYKEIEDIRLYVRNDSLIDNWRFMKVTGEIERQWWYEKALEMNGKIFWGYVDLPGTRGGNPSICLVRLLKNSLGKSLGVLVVKIKKEEVNNILRQESFETMVVNDEGIIVAASDRNVYGKKKGDLGFMPLSRRQWKSEDLDYKGKPSKVISLEFLSSGTIQNFEVISIFPLDEILKKANSTGLLGFSIISASLLLSLLLIMGFSKILSARINRISYDMHRVASGDFNFQSSITGKDEAGQLAEDLNTMVASIKKLIHEIYESDLQKNALIVRQKEIKLKMLASQINPHFLFNALEAIRMEALNNGQCEIARLVKLLGRMMRMSLKVTNAMIPLESELEMVKSYLEIQKFRYSDKLSYNISDIAPEMLRQNILPLIIQPVVENAIVHGLESKEGSGLVSIEITDVKNDMRITIVDDGLGMEDETADRIRNTLDIQESADGKRIGLRNVHQRIKLVYGEQYGLSIYSKHNQGTTVEILLPKGDAAIVESIDC